MIRDRQQELERKRQDLTEQIARLEGDPALAHLKKELAALAGFDSAAYQAAVTRLRNAEALKARQANYEAALLKAADADRAAAAATESLNEVARLHSQAQAARPYLDAVESQNRYLGILTKAVEEAGQLVTNRELERDQAAAVMSGTRNPFGRGRRRASLQDADDNLARARAALDAASLEHRQQTPLITAGIAENRRAAQPHTKESLAVLDQRLAQAHRPPTRRYGQPSPRSSRPMRRSPRRSPRRSQRPPTSAWSPRLTWPACRPGAPAWPKRKRPRPPSRTRSASWRASTSNC